MTGRTRVAVCGSSLYMASLAAGLRANADLEVVRVLTVSADLPERLRELKPAVAAIDLGDSPAELPVTLLRACAGLLLLGVDPKNDDLLVFAGDRASALSVADLANIIRDKTPISIEPRWRTS